MAFLQLIYASAAVKPFTPPELRDLLAGARTRNAAAEVSGLLLYHEGSFLQILEGEPTTVQALFEKIGKDPRHANMLLLSQKTIEERNFGDWSMGFADFVSLKKGSPGFLDFLLAKSSFLDLHGDTTLVAKLVDAFQAGKWHQYFH